MKRSYLWRVNNVLRWTGFRLLATTNTEDDTIVRVDLEWIGLYGSKGWLRWEPHTVLNWVPVCLTVMGIFLGAFLLTLLVSSLVMG